MTDVAETSADTAASESGLGTIDTRREQMFPKFSADDIDRMRRYGEVKRYAAGDMLSRIGETAPGALVVAGGTGAGRTGRSARTFGDDRRASDRAISSPRSGSSRAARRWSMRARSPTSKRC